MTSLSRVHPPSPKDSLLSQVCAEGFGEDMWRLGERTMLNHCTLGPRCRVCRIRVRTDDRTVGARTAVKGYSRMTQWYKWSVLYISVLGCRL